MAWSRRIVVTGCLALAAAGAFAHAARTWANSGPVPDIPPATKTYAPQKVVYHVTDGGGWLGWQHRRLLQAVHNHLAAVGAQRLTVRIVLQGDGVDLLARAKNDEAMRGAADYLRANGVRFLVCRATLVGRKIPLDALHNVQPADLVPTGVAETAALMQEGFVYLKM